MALGLLGSTPWACGPQAVTPRRVPRIGFFSLDTTASAPLVEEFRAGLRDFGYDDGTTVRVLWRQNDGSQQANDAIVNEFVRLPVDVIVANGGEGQQTAKRSTQEIPIVIVTGNDPVESGLVQSLSKPGGNITGIGGRPSIMKRLELLREIAPRISKVALLFGDNETGNLQRRNAENAARQLGVEIVAIEVNHVSKEREALSVALSQKADALLILPVPGGNDKIAEIAFAEEHRLPAAYWDFTYGELGGLLVFADNLRPVFRQAGRFVGRILDGASPAEMPIEPPQHSHLVLNLRTARALGLTVPPSVLNIATKVVE